MNKEQALEILNEAGVSLERIDEARGAFSMRKFERDVVIEWKSKFLGGEKTSGRRSRFRLW